MVRDLLNAVPELVLALAFIGLVVALAIGAFLLARRFLAQWRDQGSVEGVLGLAAMVMTLFALVLAFVVVNLYSDYTSASGDVTEPADRAKKAGSPDSRAAALPTRVSIRTGYQRRRPRWPRGSTTMVVRWTCAPWSWGGWRPALSSR